MGMFSKIWKMACLSLAFGLAIYPISVLAMGGKPEATSTPALSPIEQAPTSSVTLKDLAKVYWPDSNATTVQQEDALKNILGKAVTWEITVAQIQRDGGGYLIQGRSDANMVGTFSYVTPKTETESLKIRNAAIGSILKIKGIVNDFQMRHIVLKPAAVIE